MLKKLFGLLFLKLLVGSAFHLSFSQTLQLSEPHFIERSDLGHICTLDPTEFNAHYRYAPLRLRAKLPHSETAANFQITYRNNCGGDTWPEEAVTAFEYALDIWSSYIQSEIPIRIEATWDDLGEGVLGSAGPTSFFTLSGEGIVEDTFYPIALASAITGIDIVEDDRFDIDFDLVVNINCEFDDWYFDTNANTPAGLIDLVTVVLHEVGHGIGFTGSVSGSAGAQQASWGFQAQGGGIFALIYDVFTLDGPFHNIIDETFYPRNSNALYNAVTGRNGGVFFGGTEAEFAINGKRVPLFAPNTWRQGSSYSHFDLNFFSNTENALMRPAIDRALAIHSPGPAFCGLLDDIGWPLGPSCLELIEDNLVLQRPELSLPFNGDVQIALQPDFLWTTVGGAEGYQLQIATDYDFNQQIANEFITETTFSVDNDLDFNTLYFWRVRALSAEGNSNWSSIWRFSTTINPPEIVSLQSPADGTENLHPGFELRWGSAERADRYNLQISDDPEFNNIVINRSIQFTGFASTQSLEFFTDYYWRVRGTNNGGEGEWSDVWAFKTIIERPETVQLGVPSDDENQVSVNSQFTWEPSERATDYLVQISTDEDFTTIPIQANLSETTFTNMGPLEFATIYFWRVKAVNIGGESEWSEVSSFTTEVRETKINPNYPNPFNSTTTLRYQLSAQMDVLIDVFDITGRRVVVAVNEQLSAGVYFIQLNSSNLASGTYFVRFVAGDVMDVQKMSVIK